MNSRLNIVRLRFLMIMAAVLLLTSLPASSSLAQISEEAMQQCAALSNSMRRLTCFDLLAQLRAREQSDTTGRAAGVMVRLPRELMSELDGWIESQSEPKPNQPEAIRRLLELALRSQKESW
jgi:hypothetical protein